MKKVILSFAIVLSSFFIFNFKVKALSEYSFDISFDNINEDFFKIKSLAEDYLTNSDYDNFVIYLRDSNFYVYFFNLNDSKIVCKNFAGFACFINTYVYNYELSSTSSNLKKIGESNYPQFNDPNNFLYSSAKVSMEDVTVTFSYNTFTYKINENDDYLPVYDFYLKYNDIFVPEEPHKEEKQVLESFYSLCIEKIKYLGEIFMSNYIYLTTLVVCILMFVFSLIVRRFL